MTDKYRMMIIVPVGVDTYNEEIKDDAMSVAPPDLEIDVTNLPAGTPCIESRCDLDTNAPYVIDVARKVEQEGYHGIFVSDFDMCGVEAAREAVDIPVLGGCRAQAYTAMMLGQRFSIVSILQSVRDFQVGHMREFGIWQNFASIKILDIPVDQLNDKELVIEKAVEASADAIRNDGADSIIFGCTGFIGIADPVARKLEEKLEVTHVPVTDPNRTAVSYLYMLMRNALRQSSLTYATPPEH